MPLNIALHADHPERLLAESCVTKGNPDIGTFASVTIQVRGETPIKVYSESPAVLNHIADVFAAAAAGLADARRPDPNTVIGQGGEIVPDEPEPDTCAECGELAAGFDDGTPLCAAHYRSKTAFWDASNQDPPNGTGLGPFVPEPAPMPPEGFTFRQMPVPAPAAVNAQEGPIDTPEARDQRAERTMISEVIRYGN